MSLLAKLMDKRLGAYQRELIEIHYAEVENMYRQIRDRKSTRLNFSH